MKTQTIDLRRLVLNSSDFGEAIEKLTTETGMSPGKAIMFARAVEPCAYNEWQRDRVLGRIRPKRGGRSIMSHFKIIGG